MADEEKQIGEVSHYFGNIGVAVINLTDSLKEGDEVRIVGGDTDFTQTVSSMEVEREKIQEANKGDSVGLKVGQKVRPGYKVYKI